MHSHGRDCVTVRLCVYRGVNAVGHHPSLCQPLSLNLLIPFLLISQDVGVESPHLQQLLLGVGTPSPVGPEIIQH